MKYLLIITFVVFGLTCKGQDKLIGRSFSYINDIMKSEKHAITDSAYIQSANQKCFTYKVSEGYTYTFYFTKDSSICTGFREFIIKPFLITAIEGLNKDYVKVDNNNWISADNNYKVNLTIDGPLAILTHKKL